MHSICPETSCWVRRSLKLSSVFGFLDDDDDIEAVEDCFLLGLLLLVFWTVSEADRASWPRGFPYKEKLRSRLALPIDLNESAADVPLILEDSDLSNFDVNVPRGT